MYFISACYKILLSISCFFLTTDGTGWGSGELRKIPFPHSVFGGVPGGVSGVYRHTLSNFRHPRRQQLATRISGFRHIHTQTTARNSKKTLQTLRKRNGCNPLIYSTIAPNPLVFSTLALLLYRGLCGCNWMLIINNLREHLA
jgi:hypothetical protein